MANLTCTARGPDTLFCLCGVIQPVFLLVPRYEINQWPGFCFWGSVAAESRPKPVSTVASTRYTRSPQSRDRSAMRWDGSQNCIWPRCSRHGGAQLTHAAWPCSLFLFRHVRSDSCQHCLCLKVEHKEHSTLLLLLCCWCCFGKPACGIAPSPAMRRKGRASSACAELAS